MPEPKKIRPPLDALDHKLLGLLVADARATNQSLADALGIAPSTCLARLKALKETGVIERFTIDVDPEALGRSLQALISVRLRPGARHLMQSFAEDLRSVADISQFFVLAGTDDFLIHVKVRDTAHVREFVLEHLSSNPAVAATQTNLIFEHVWGDSLN